MTTEKGPVNPVIPEAGSAVPADIEPRVPESWGRVQELIATSTGDPEVLPPPQLDARMRTVARLAARPRHQTPAIVRIPHMGQTKTPKLKKQ